MNFQVPSAQLPGRSLVRIKALPPVPPTLWQTTRPFLSADEGAEVDPLSSSRCFPLYFSSVLISKLKGPVLHLHASYSHLHQHKLHSNQRKGPRGDTKPWDGVLMLSVWLYIPHIKLIDHVLPVDSLQLSKFNLMEAEKLHSGTWINKIRLQKKLFPLWWGLLFLNEYDSVGLHKWFSLEYFGLGFSNTFETFPKITFLERRIYQDKNFLLEIHCKYFFNLLFLPPSLPRSSLSHISALPLSDPMSPSASMLLGIKWSLPVTPLEPI